MNFARLVQVAEGIKIDLTDSEQVERYLPGLSRADLLPRLSLLEPVSEELRESGVEVRYLGSTIVLEDEACFCEFEGSSVAGVAEANRRADLPFDRIVPALLVQPNYRSH